MPEATNSELIDAMNLLSEHVDGRLPHGYCIRINMRNDEADIELIDPDGENVDLSSEVEVSPLNDAICNAKHHAAAMPHNY